MLNLEEADQNEEGIPIEVYATPRAEHSTTAGVEPKPHESIQDLADHAKERLQSLFSTTPAGSNAPPILPVPVRQHPREESHREPSVRSPTIAASEPEKQTASLKSKKLQSSDPQSLVSSLWSSSQDSLQKKEMVRSLAQRKPNPSSSTTCRRQKRTGSGGIKSVTKSSLAQTNLTKRGHGSMKSLTRKPQGLSWKNDFKNLGNSSRWIPSCRQR